MIRTLNWLYASRNDHLSTVVLKLIGNFCKYNTLRPYVLAALVALLTNNGEAVKTSVMGLRYHYYGSELLVANALNELILAMNQASSSLKSGIYRKLLATLSVLLRKTDQIVVVRHRQRGQECCSIRMAVFIYYWNAIFCRHIFNCGFGQ